MPNEETTTTEGGTGGTSTVVETVEEIVEKVTNTTSPAASAEVLVDWVIRSLGSALNLGGMAATVDAVKAHVGDLEAKKTELASAVAANS